MAPVRPLNARAPRDPEDPEDPDGTDPSEVGQGSSAAPLEGDPLLERAVQLYLELRLMKRPPESPAGAQRKTFRWLEGEASREGRPLEDGWREWLDRAFLDVEGDVAESAARRRQGRRPRPATGPTRP